MVFIDKELKFKIISEGINNGVSNACRKYNISRTLYYRWLKRYKATGIDGLHDIKKSFTPVNKTNPEIEAALLSLIKQYPIYGPKYLKYIFDELGYTLSESAIYNIMKRNNLSKKENRIKFSKHKKDKPTTAIPPLYEITSGECWLFWITDFGHHSSLGHIFQYNLFDFKSRIACSRLYNKINFDNFEDILASTAIPVATTLNLTVNYLCFFNSDKILNLSKRTFNSTMKNLILEHSYDFEVHILDENYGNLNSINTLKKAYTEACSAALMPLINKNLPFIDIKLKFQDYIRNYNISHKIKFDTSEYTPVEYHNKITNSKLILPMFAYINREY